MNFRKMGWVFLCFALLLTGCSQQQDAQTPAYQAASAGSPGTALADSLPEDVLEIREKLFLTEMNDIYVNTDEYLGKTIKYEGIFTGFTWAENGVTYYSVIRYGPGCCGDDGNVGLEVIWPDEGYDYPNENDWVEAVGVLETYDENGMEYIRLRLTSLTVLMERGLETVVQ